MLLTYATLGIAVVCEVFGDSMMKLSDGFRHKAPILGIVVGYGLSFCLMAQTFAQLPLGFVYAAWNGLGIALTAVVGAVFWGEGFNLKKCLGALVIIAGIAVLKMGV